MGVQDPVSRRGFLKIIALGGAAGLALKLGVDQVTRVQPVSVTRLLMGTVVNLTVVHTDPAKAQTAITACLDHMESLEALLSRFRPESQLSRLNRDGELAKPNPHLVGLVRASQRISQLSKGAFDITIKPVMDAIQASRIPSDEARSAVGYQNVAAEDSQVTFLHSGMGITLDGIAKGYIIDRGAEVLQTHGFENILVEAGGDLVARGQRADGDAWRLGVAHPRPESAPGYLTAFSVTDQAVATSGDYIQYYRDDKSLHHIIDPETQTSPNELASATVLAPTAMLSDALSTTVMVLGLEAGLALVDKLPDVEALLVNKQSQVKKSAGFPE